MKEKKDKNLNTYKAGRKSSRCLSTCSEGNVLRSNYEAD